MFKNLSFEKWNNAFDILKDKFRRKRLNDPFGKYLHDTYFSLRAKTSKLKNSSETSKRGAANTAIQFMFIHSLSESLTTIHLFLIFPFLDQKLL